MNKRKKLILAALICAIIGAACSCAAAVFNYIQGEWKLGVIMTLIMIMDIILLVMDASDLRWQLEMEKHEKGDSN